MNGGSTRKGLRSKPCSCLLLVAALAMSACTSRGVYEGIQAGNRHHCASLPPTQYDACMAKANIPYDDYARERQQLLSPDA